jgi:DNA-binding NarL/FixJ family response regulator
MENINIVIVDDQNLFRQSLALLINSVNEFTLVGDYAGGQQLIDALQNIDTPIDIAIIDMDMPEINGIELNKFLHQHHPQIKVIILSVHVNEMLISKMINNGAASYIAKNCDKDELILAVTMVFKTGFYFNNDVINAVRNSAHHRLTANDILNGLPVILSNREQQILQLICKEYNNAEIAKELYLSVRTIEGHRTSLIDKINCRNTAGLVLFAIKHHLFDINL